MRISRELPRFAYMSSRTGNLTYISFLALHVYDDHSLPSLGAGDAFIHRFSYYSQEDCIANETLLIPL